MTTYKLTIPVKCSTLHRIKKLIFNTVWTVIKILILALLGVLHGLAFYIFFNVKEVSEYAISNGGSVMPYGEYVLLGVLFVLDVVVILGILDAYDIVIDIDCLRGDKQRPSK